jgi:predicted DNA-binding antitoxin AbrB/MazE fold protein
MARMIEAVYEQGVFRPLEPVRLQEGQRVQVYLSYEPEQESTAEEDLEQKMRRLGYKAFEDIPEEEWAKISEGWKRG